MCEGRQSISLIVAPCMTMHVTNNFDLISHLKIKTWNQWKKCEPTSFSAEPSWDVSHAACFRKQQKMWEGGSWCSDISSLWCSHKFMSWFFFLMISVVTAVTCAPFGFLHWGFLYLWRLLIVQQASLWLCLLILDKTRTELLFVYSNLKWFWLPWALSYNQQQTPLALKPL